MKTPYVSFDLIKWTLKLLFVFPILLTGCGGGSGSSDDNSEVTATETVSITLPDSIIANISTDGTLTATISINSGSPRLMEISGNTASVVLNDIPTGTVFFTVTVTFDHHLYAPLVIASAIKSFTITTDDDDIFFADSDFNTAMDEDGDGRTNLEELSKNSTSNPFMPVCILDTSTLGNCEL